MSNPRGPYSRLRWFCNDGSVHPPNPYPCAELGGGRQHAEYSADRQRLAELGFSVGTIFAAMTPDELRDADNRNQRLRELPIERYLIDIDNGWVLREAQNYRGRVQLENEEATGRTLLLSLLTDADWINANYMLVRESIRVIPHAGGGDDRTRKVRREAIEVADLDSSFERLRIEIHTSPSAITAERVRAWNVDKPEDIAALAEVLASGLDDLYGPSGRRVRLEEQRRLLAQQAATAMLAARLQVDGDAATRFALLAAWLRDARHAITGPSTAATRLLLFDAAREVESELTVVTAELLADGTLSREMLLDIGRRLVDAGYGAGLLTQGEYDEVVASWPAASDGTLTLADYARSLNMLRRVPQWAVGTVRYTFAEPLTRYTALEPRAASFVDDLLRGSPLTGIAEVSRRIGRDYANLTGVTQRIGNRSDVAAFGVNAGAALGRLQIFETSEALEHGQYGRNDIVVLPETVAELSRVAGIVTLGEGNPLSHVQLLARNFAIPNVAILPEVLAELRPYEGLDVVLAVASDSSLVLTPASAVDAELAALLRPANETAAELTVPRPDLAMRQPYRLALSNRDRRCRGLSANPDSVRLAIAVRWSRWTGSA
ncbi:MAG: hypothetical protein R3305_06165 [Gammaproteobacteria bacterium]|nr:hypothetical protein [Gammaproteobacteria bacterium]